MKKLYCVTRLSPIRARIALLALLGVGIFAGSGAVARAQEISIDQVAQV